MNNKIIIGILGLLVLGGFAFMLTGHNAVKGKKEAANIASLNPDAGVKCKYTVAVLGDNTQNSTLYIYKNHFRYDTNLSKETQGQKDLHMIDDGEYSYIWGKGIIGGLGAGKGFKMKSTRNENADENGIAPDIDIEALKKNNFKAPGMECEPWNPDMDMFKAPNNLTFMDMDKFMGGGMMNVGGVGMQNTCDACDMIPDAKAKAECKKSCKDDNK